MTVDSFIVDEFLLTFADTRGLVVNGDDRSMSCTVRSSRFPGKISIFLEDEVEYELGCGIFGIIQLGEGLADTFGCGVFDRDELGEGLVVAIG
jgi:hypothetical protein